MQRSARCKSALTDAASAGYRKPDRFFSPGKSPSMPDGIRYGWWLALIFLPRKVAEKTWVNHLTHTLTHNGIDFSGEGSTKQHPAVPKSEKIGIFKTFFKLLGSMICVHKPGFPKRNRLPTEANQTLLPRTVCVPEGI